MVPVIGDNCDRLSVVPSKHTNHRCAALRLERNPIADSEFKHLGVGAHVIEETKTLNDPIVQVDEFRFGQLVNVDSRQGSLSINTSRVMLRLCRLTYKVTGAPRRH